MSRLTERQVRILGSALFLVYMGGLIYFLFFAENYGRSAQGIGYRYNLVPLREIRRFLENEEILGRRAVFLNVAGNILGFVPFGAILRRGRCDPEYGGRFCGISAFCGLQRPQEETVRRDPGGQVNRSD